MSERGPTLVSVVIPALNSARVIGEQLRALSDQTYRGPWEIVVADNGSSDGTSEIVERWSDRLPPTKVIEASAKRGAGYARNAGAAAAEGEILLFCDADDVASAGWIEAMVEGCRDSDLVGGARDVATLNDPMSRSWHTPRQVTSLPTALGFLPYASSSNIGVRAEVFRDLGGWDEGFEKAASEDAEFCWRAQLAGYRIGFAPNAVMKYRYRSDLPGHARQYFYYGLNQARLYRMYKDRGLARSSLKDALKIWMGLALRMPNVLRGATRRGIWLRLAALRWGRIRGSIRNRVIFL